MLWHPKNISKKMEKRGKEKDKKKLCFLGFVCFLFVFCLFVLAWRKGIKRRKRERARERGRRHVLVCVLLWRVRVRVSLWFFFFVRCVFSFFRFFFPRDIRNGWMDGIGGLRGSSYYGSGGYPPAAFTFYNQLI